MKCGFDVLVSYVLDLYSTPATSEDERGLLVLDNDQESDWPLFQLFSKTDPTSALLGKALLSAIQISPLPRREHLVSEEEFDACYSEL